MSCFLVDYCPTVKGLAEVTEKQARGQAAPQLQQAIFGTAGLLGQAQSLSSILPPAVPMMAKKRKRNKKKDQGMEGIESDEERSNKRTVNSDGLKTHSQRLATQRLLASKETPSLSDQIESSRILEQSMATAEVIIKLLYRLCINS